MDGAQVSINWMLNYDAESTYEVIMEWRRKYAVLSALMKNLGVETEQEIQFQMQWIIQATFLFLKNMDFLNKC